MTGVFQSIHSYAGELSPAQAWGRVVDAQGLLIDVRSQEERVWVGYVPQSIHIPWAQGLPLQLNPFFLQELEQVARKDQLLLFLCRSAKRSAMAAQVAAEAGFTQAFNVLEGFEGDPDANGHRGTFNGWRFHQLPWVQD